MYAFVDVIVSKYVVDLEDCSTSWPIRRAIEHNPTTALQLVQCLKNEGLWGIVTYITSVDTNTIREEPIFVVAVG
jgi:hypothetical protein